MVGVWVCRHYPDDRPDDQMMMEQRDQNMPMLSCLARLGTTEGGERRVLCHWSSHSKGTHKTERKVRSFLLWNVGTLDSDEVFGEGEVSEP